MCVFCWGLMGLHGIELWNIESVCKELQARDKILSCEVRSQKQIANIDKEAVVFAGKELCDKTSRHFVLVNFLYSRISAAV